VTVREKLYLLVRIALTGLIVLLNTFGVKCVSHPTPKDIGVENVLFLSSLATLALYWLLWFLMSDETFTRYRLSYSLYLSVLIAACGQLYASSLCDR
jgi:hypothetical protein